ncbi:MAG: hypothetical protein NTZ98_17655 [Acidobacteria bacterium]|nr:hypothetical protein [Acidobacteriota bacterium]
MQKSKKRWIYRCVGLAAVVTLGALAPARVEDAKEQGKNGVPHAAIKVEHYSALKDVILDGDILFAFCTRQPDPSSLPPGFKPGMRPPAAEPGRPAGPPVARRLPQTIFDQKRLAESLAVLNAVHDPRVRKALVLSSVFDLKANLKRFPKDLFYVLYNTEPGMTPPEELQSLEESVREFSAIAHGAGLKLGWGPTNAMLTADEARFLGLAKYVDSMGLQHQRILQLEGLEAFVAQTRRRSELVRKINPEGTTLVQVVVGRGTNEQLIQALKAVLPYIGEISVWTMQDTKSAAEILTAVRASAK